MTMAELDRDTILQAIASWPVEERVALARAILERAASNETTNRPQRPSWRELAGIAAVPGQEPPTDEEVERWLDEHRMEKYGG
jgi:hypothetical protein